MDCTNSCQLRLPFPLLNFFVEREREREFFFPHFVGILLHACVIRSVRSSSAEAEERIGEAIELAISSSGSLVPEQESKVHICFLSV